MSFAQGTPSVNTLINSSNCIVLGNTTSGTALTVQQLGAGAVMNVATTTGSSALFVSSTGQVGVGTTGPNGTAHVWNVAATGGPKLSIGDNTAFAPGGLHSIAALTSTLGAGNGNSIILGRTNATNDAFQMTFMNVAQGSTTNYLGFNAFGSSYTAALAITAGGNVGIGTTSPSALLQIRGTTNIGGQQGTPSSNTIASFLNDLTYGTNEAVDIEIGSQSRQIGNFGSVYKYRVGTINSGTAYGGSNFYINAVPTAAGAYTSDGTALNRMTIRYDGNVGIGLTGPSYQLDLSTDGARKLTSTTWLTGSDQRIKTDIESANLQMCYDTVKSIDLKYFKWNFPTDSNVVPDDKHSLGFIAQEIQKVFPNAVSESNSYGYTDFLSLNTDQILKAMYGALKQTMADKEALEQSLSSLEQRLAAAGL